MKQTFKLLHLCLLSSITGVSAASAASDDVLSVPDDTIIEQRRALAGATNGAGFGPQSPRDINTAEGENQRIFAHAPAFTRMNLCNIHFHENAEHKGGEFTTFAGNGNGNGKGYGTGFKYDGDLTDEELEPVNVTVGPSDHGDLVPGDTIEVHFVHSTAEVTPGPTLGACVSEAITNPQLRVEAVIAVLVNDEDAVSFMEMTQIEVVDGLYQAVNLPDYLGAPVTYAGSTTGPSYNEKASPFQVTWGVRPNVVKVDIRSVGDWLSDNVFNEDHAHGVRNLVVNPLLLSPISE
ncbi:MAG: delta-class carbonic anhydrase [Pseudomonadota bacterium]